MTKSWHAYMKVGLIHFMAFPGLSSGEGPILETLAQIAADEFFTAVEVTWIKDPEIRAKAAKLLALSKLEVGFGAQPLFLGTGLNLNSFDPQERAQAVAQLKVGIDQAVELGARRMSFLSGWDPGIEKRAEARKLLVDSIIQGCAYARERGIPLSLETFDRNVDKKCLIGPHTEAVEVARAVREAGYPEFGLTVDLSHFPLQGERTRDALHTVKEYLVHAHMGNCILDKNHPAYGDSHPAFGCPGGVNDVAELVEFLRGLMEIGFLDDGKEKLPVVSFEVKPLPGEDSAVVIANAKRTLTAAWRLV